jgi:N-ethylmaleimide reductase
MVISESSNRNFQSPLFSPASFGSLNVPNRIVMAPMTRTRAEANGTPQAINATYYAQRSSAGLIVTECTQVSDQGHGIIRCPGIHTKAQIEGWKQVTTAVHAAGGRIYLQVWHCGRVSHPSIMGGKQPVAPSAVAATGDFFTPDGRVPFPVPRPLEVTEIKEIVDDFAAAASNAKLAGFDGVELHGAFGYLPDQFLQDGTNHRADRYGGSVINRARFMLEILEALTGVWETGRVGVKLSPSNRFYGMYDSNAFETFGHLVREINRMKLGYIHMMEPSANDLKAGNVQIKETTKVFRPMFDGTLITNGGYDYDKADQTISDRIADAVSFGTLFIANPDLPYRLLTKAPLNEPDRNTFYGEGAKGYIDYRFLSRE